SPASVDGVVYLATDGGVLHAVDATTGQQRWSRRLSRTAGLSSSVAVAGETVYAGDSQGVLHAVDVASGEERWYLAVGSYYSSPAIVGGLVCIGSDDGALVAVGDPQEDLP